MRDVFATAAKWLRDENPCALATLVESFESSPAQQGTTIAVDRGGHIAGNIGAGCYESDIVEACAAAIEDGVFRVLRINLTSDDALMQSSGCGGALKIAVWRPGKTFVETAEAIARGVYDVQVDLQDGYRFIVKKKRRLLVVGATTLANELARIGRALDFSVSVVDPRAPFATRERLSEADEIVREWPDEYLPRALRGDVPVVIVSHDPKFDIAALECALRSEAPYIGLLGSRRSQAARRETLREMGFDEFALSRIHGPAGLDLGGQSTAETAVSILAHVIATRNARTGIALDVTTGAIHAGAGEAIPR